MFLFKLLFELSIPPRNIFIICYLTKQFMGDIELVNTSFDLTLMGSIFFNFSYHISRSNKTCLLYFILFFYFHFTLCCFTIVYWFCHTLTWISHGCTCIIIILEHLHCALKKPPTLWPSLFPSFPSNWPSSSALGHHWSTFCHSRFACPKHFV